VIEKDIPMDLLLAVYAKTISIPQDNLTDNF